MKYFIIGLLTCLALPFIVLLLGAAGVIVGVAWKVLLYGAGVFVLIMAIGWLICTLFNGK